MCQALEGDEQSGQPHIIIYKSAETLAHSPSHTEFLLRAKSLLRVLDTVRADLFLASVVSFQYECLALDGNYWDASFSSWERFWRPE